MPRPIPYVLLLACTVFLSSARADEQDDAIAHVVNLKGYITRDETKPSRPVVGVSLASKVGIDLGIKKLAAFPELKTLGLSFTKLTDEQISEVVHLKSLVELDLGGTMVTAVSLDKLAETKIETLNLAFTEISDADLKSLQKMKSLKSVQFLLNKKLTNACVADLAAIPNLEHLSFSGMTTISDEGVKALAAAKNLKILNLRETKVSDVGIKHLAACTKLEVLTIENTAVTGDGLKSLSALPLKRLNFGGKSVIDDDLKVAASFASLESLWVYEGSITNAGIKYLAGHKNLNDLSLTAATRMNDEAMKDISALPALKVLMLYDCKITEVGLAELAAASKLEYLMLPGSPTDAWLIALNKAGKLHTIDNCYKMNGPRFGNRPKNLAEVEGIDIHGGEKMTAEGFKQFAGCKNLKTLMLNKTGLNDLAMKEIAVLTELESIGLFQMPNLTDAGLKELVGLKKCKSIYFSSTPGVTDAGIAELRKALPNCKIEK